MYEPTCMRLVTEAGVVDALVDHPIGLHVSELSRRTGIEQGKLAHILRFLSMKHCFVEGDHTVIRPLTTTTHHFTVSADVFANSRLSLPLLSTTPMASLIGIWASEFYEGAGNICETYRDPQYGSSYAPERSALMKFFNNRDGAPNRTFFDWMVNGKSVNPHPTSDRKAWLISEINQKVNNKVRLGQLSPMLPSLTYKLITKTMLEVRDAHVFRS